MYIRKTYRFANAIEVQEYHSARYGAPGQARQRKQKLTPEQVEKKNQRNREDTCRRKLRAHLCENDMYVTLTYAKEARPPDMVSAKEDFSKMIRKLRKEYRDLGHDLKWIRNIEVGTRGAWHIHMVMNRIRDADILLQRLWSYGAVHIQLMNTDGEFRKLARYMTKTPLTDPRLKEAQYSTSRNLPIPEPEKKILQGRSWRKRQIPEGWYLDKESCWEGINPVTGYMSRQYSLLRIRDDRKYHRRN